MRHLIEINATIPAKPVESIAVLHPILVRARNDFEIDGYAFLAGHDVRSIMHAPDVIDLVEAARSAPPDVYDKIGSRFRMYHQATYFPWNGALVVNPPFQDGPSLVPYSTYFQQASFNIEHGGQHRRFTPFSEQLLSNFALRALVSLCFKLIPRWRLKGAGRWPVLVGMHLIRLQSDGRRAAVATPNHAHQDGEPFTFVIMLERDNIEGGVSFILDASCAGQHPDDVPDRHILASGTLMEPLDIAAVDDERVAHHVTGVLGAGGRPGFRSVLLIDFSEMQPIRTPAR